MEHTILIIEDSVMYGNMLKRCIINGLGFNTIWAQTYAEAESILEENDAITLALVDLVLPDALNGESVDLTISHNVPTVIVTSNISDDIQEFVWKKRVVDYVIKEGGHSTEYILGVIERIIKNRDTGILVVDDSSFARSHIRELLEVHQFQIFEAENGLEALDILEKEPTIKLVLTDYKMPQCDGFELIKRIRRSYHLDKLAIIGLSAQGNHKTSVKFIKYGANDFLSKPFISEQLYCRINQNIKVVEHFESLREITLIDYLTNINNRRYLFETGDIIFENALRTKSVPVVAMLDIDHFKHINDTYGHIVGDEILKTMAEALKLSLRKSDVISRYGGEEFCIIANNMQLDHAPKVFNKLREMVANLSFLKIGVNENITVSIGLCMELKSSFYEMVKIADQKLYEAKVTGRNKVVY